VPRAAGKFRAGKAPPAQAALDGPEVLGSFDLASDVLARLEIYAALLRKWQRTINLVASSTLDQLWTRHFADSLQVSQAAPDAKLWIDLGSGAGFPGLVTAIRLAGIEGARVHLVESDQRKCAFLRDVSRETGAPVDIHPVRIEALLADFTDPIEAISGRALAPLQNLIMLSEKLLEKGAIGVFHQGQSASSELTDADITRRFKVEEIPSKLLPGSRLAIVRAKSMI
jgi:16S rRNA (guanine527-N7)-methyltransferase